MHRNSADITIYRKKNKVTKVIYAFALSFIALSMIGSSIIMFSSVESNRGDSHVVNLSGRQRMLSQRITKCMLAVSVVQDREESNLYIEEMRASLAEWINAHNGLQYGDDTIELPSGERSKVIRVLFMQILPSYEQIVTSIQSFLDEQQRAATMSARRKLAAKYAFFVLESQKQFLPLMDKITFQFDAESRNKIIRLKRLEYMILAAGLMLLLLEFVIVFRPTLKRMHAVIVELAKKNNELTQSEQSLYEAKKMREKIISLISHDLKGSFTVVHGAIRLLNNREQSHVDEKLVFESLTRNVNTTRSMLENILDWMKKQDAGEHIQKETVDLRNVALECIAIFADGADAKNISIENRIESGETVFTDRFVLLTIIRNLINNAVKFTPHGGAITVFTELREGSRVIGVSDTGVGIPPERIKEIFSAGAVLSRPGTDGEAGTGIGLVMCREFAEKLGAELTVESTPGKGSVFRVFLGTEDVI